jgi:DDE superfamily endonuclease
MLLTWFSKLMLEFNEVFAQGRTRDRAMRLMLSGLLTVGRRWITRMISTAGRDQQDWSADYRVFSRSPWKSTDIFEPIVRNTVLLSDGDYIPVALDDTNVPRRGLHVKAARWLRDPLSPPFHINLRRAIRFLHFSMLLRHGPAEGDLCRGIPVRFEMVEVVKKPGKGATPEELSAYKKEKKLKNLSTYAVKAIKELRQAYDLAGASNKTLILVGDGSFCNRTVMRGTFERTILVARTRKDAALCEPAPAGGRKIYGDRVFTPQSVREDQTIPWQTGSFIHGGGLRRLKFKEITNVLWRGGTQRCPLRLMVLEPTGYRVSPKSKLSYREPAFLLTRDMSCPASILIQSYLDRWQIEVNHRDLKDVLGLGEAQVWADRSVPRQPSFVAASYSILLLAAHYAYGPSRTSVYDPLPKWRQDAKRPSCLDLVAQLRKEAIAAPQKLEAFGIELRRNAMTLKAAG